MSRELRAQSLLALALAVVAGLVFALSAPAERERRFEIDEAEWLTISIQTTRQARGEVSPFDGIPPSPYRDEDGNPWKVGIHQSTFGYMNPLLPKLVLGGLATALGHEQYDPAVYPRFAKELGPARRQQALQTVVPPLPAVRRVVLVLAALSAGLVFLVGARAGGTAAGVFAFGTFVASPLVLDHATRIRTDFFPIALGLGAAAFAQTAGPALGGARGPARAVLAALALGLLAGLAVASKLNGALVALMVGAWITVAAWRHRPASASVARTLLAGGLASAVVALGLWFAFSPHLWPAPLENLSALLEAWEGDLEHQKAKFGERLGRADSLGEHFALASRAVAGEYEPLRAHTGLPLGLPLVALGLALLVSRVLRTTDEEPRFRASAALVFVLVAGLGTALWIPFGRDNFFLGLAAPVALLEGLALGLPVAALLARRRRESEA